MTPRLEIDLLRTFVTIAQTSTLSRAATRIGRTQAAISVQVKRLEDMAGQVLFYRTGRGVELTQHGERLLVHAQKILRYHDEAIAELSGKGLRGTIRFGCPDDYAVVYLPHLLRGFASRHPEVLVDIFCAPSSRLRECLKQNALDLALVSYPENIKGEVFIRHEPLVWVGCKGTYALELNPLPLALSEPSKFDHQSARKALESIGRPYRIAYASESMAGLTAVVRSGQAIAVLTQTAVPADLQILSVDSGLPVLPKVGIAVKLHDTRPSALIAAFSEYVRTTLPVI